MQFSTILQEATASLTGFEHDPNASLIDAIHANLLKHGCMVGVTTMILSHEAEFMSRGYIVDICFHPHYGHHLVWVPAPEDDYRASFITTHAEVDITVLI